MTNSPLHKSPPCNTPPHSHRALPTAADVTFCMHAEQNAMTIRNYEIMNTLGDQFFCENDTKFQNEIKNFANSGSKVKKAHKHFAHDTDLSFSILNIKRIYYSAEQDTQQILLKLQTKFTWQNTQHTTQNANMHFR